MSPPFYSTTVPLILGFNRILSYLLDLIYFLLFHFSENSLDIPTLLYNSSAQTLLMHSSLTTEVRILGSWESPQCTLTGSLLPCLLILPFECPTADMLHNPVSFPPHLPFSPPQMLAHLLWVSQHHLFFKVQVPPFSWSLLWWSTPSLRSSFPSVLLHYYL